MKMKVYGVSELTKTIKALLEESFPSVWVEGELSNLRTPSSGHIYFSLKDEHSQIRCVMFRSHALALVVDLANGIKLQVWGNIGVYERDGTYQLYAQEVKPAGLGELAIRFEELKRRLKEEGLFDPKHKKPLPEFPETIGIVTSSTGAAIRDIINVARRRFPSCKLILNPVRVQGSGAAKEIATAIAEFNDYGVVDLLIVGRGGGSIEDLWAFNEEVLARAIFTSRVPIISAVGHEIDFTISDFTADVRAATPSAAVEQALPDQKEVIFQISSALQRMEDNLLGKIEGFREKLRSLQLSYGFRRPADILAQKQQARDELERKLEKNLSHMFDMWTTHFHSLNSRLESLNPQSILARGYSISRKLPERKILRDPREVEQGDKIEVQLHKGKVRAEVKKQDL